MLENIDELNTIGGELYAIFLSLLHYEIFFFFFLFSLGTVSSRKIKSPGGWLLNVSHLRVLISCFAKRTSEEIFLRSLVLQC